MSGMCQMNIQKNNCACLHIWDSCITTGGGGCKIFCWMRQMDENLFKMYMYIIFACAKCGLRYAECCANASRGGRQGEACTRSNIHENRLFYIICFIPCESCVNGSEWGATCPAIIVCVRMRKKERYWHTGVRSQHNPNVHKSFVWARFLLEIRWRLNFMVMVGY